MNEPVYDEEYRGFTIEIECDVGADDPRNHRGTLWSGTLYEESYRGRTRYGIGDEPVNFDYYDDGWTGWLKEMHEDDPIAFAIPVQIQDYGSSGYQFSWDAPVKPGDDVDDGNNAMYVVTKKQVYTNRAIKRISPKALTDEIECAKADLAELKAWMEGDVFYFLVKDHTGEIVDSCGGFYGDYRGYVLQEAHEQADYYADTKAQKAELAAIAGV